MVVSQDEKDELKERVQLRADLNQLRLDHNALKSNITRVIWTIGGALLLQLTDAVPKILTMVGK